MKSACFISFLLLAPLAGTAVSVTDFGAKGDGVADDTCAIQAAFGSGKNVVTPEGVFRITDALRPKPTMVRRELK